MALFIGGNSTNPEIEKLRKAVSVEVGKSVSHQDVAAIVGVKVGEARFKTITSRWRKMIWSDTKIRIVSEDKAFLFLTADEASRRGRRDIRYIGRATGRLYQRVDAISVSDLSESERETHLLTVRETHAMLEVARHAAKTIALPAAVKSDRIRNEEKLKEIMG